MVIHVKRCAPPPRRWAILSFCLLMLFLIAVPALAVLPTVTVTKGADAWETSDEQIPGYFLVSRTGDGIGDLTVRYTSSGGDLPNDGTAYTLLSGSIVIPDGQLTARINVTPISNAVDEGVPSKTVGIQLSADAAYTVGTTPAVTLNLYDDDMAAPTGLMANGTPSVNTAVGTVQIPIKWTNNNSGKHTVYYEVQRKFEPDGEYTVCGSTAAISSGTLVSFVAGAGLTPGATYTFRVRAFYIPYPPVSNAPTVRTYSGFSNEFTIAAPVTGVRLVKTFDAGRRIAGFFTVTRTATTPDAPLTVYYTVSGTAIPGPDGSPTADYVTLPGSVTIPAGSTTARIDVVPINNGITFATDRTVIVTLAEDAAHYTRTTTTAVSMNFVAKTANVPGPVASLQIIAAAPVNGQNGGVTLTWVNTWQDQTGVEIQRRLASDPNSDAYYTTLATVGATDTSYTDMTVPGATYPDYVYRVRAVQGTLQTSSWVVCGNPVWYYPTGLVATLSSSTSARLTWTDNSAIESGFQIQQSTTSSSSGFTAIGSVGPNTTSYEAANLTVGGTYYFRVYGLYGTALSGGPTNVTSLTASTAPTVMITKTADAAEPASAGTFTVTRCGWGSIAASLTVKYTYSGLPNNNTRFQTINATQVVIPANATSADIVVTPIDNNLVEDAETCTVTLTTNGSAYLVGSPNTATMNFTSEDAVPAAPTNLVGTFQGTSCILTWTDHATNEDGFDIAQLVNGAYVKIGEVGANTTSYTVTGLTLGTTYSFKVRANYHDALFSGWSNTLTTTQPVVTIAKTVDASEPDTVGVFTVTRTGSTALLLNVQYSVSGQANNNTQYQTLSGTVVIPAGSATGTIVVTPIDDTAVEDPQTITVTLTAQTAYAVGTPDAASLTLTSDDTNAPPDATPVWNNGFTSGVIGNYVKPPVPTGATLVPQGRNGVNALQLPSGQTTSVILKECLVTPGVKYRLTIGAKTIGPDVLGQNPQTQALFFETYKADQGLLLPGWEIRIIDTANKLPYSGHLKSYWQYSYQSDWYDYRQYFYAPANAYKIQVIFTNPGGANTLLVDSVQLVQSTDTNLLTDAGTFNGPFDFSGWNEVSKASMTLTAGVYKLNIAQGGYALTDPVPVTPGAYRIAGTKPSTTAFFYDAKMQRIGYQSVSSTFTVPTGCAFLQLYVANGDVQQLTLVRN